MGRQRARAFLCFHGQQADGGEPENGSGCRGAVHPSELFPLPTVDGRSPYDTTLALFSWRTVLRLHLQRLIYIFNREERRGPDPHCARS
jgi:hypothetical protein